jgi:hypothetical protein
MGQTIEILSMTVIDSVLVVDTDRSLGGQDGEAFSGPEQAAASSTFPARLAGRLFEADAGIDHVFVLGNTVTVRRRAGWDDQSEATAGEIVSRFFRVYE